MTQEAKVARFVSKLNSPMDTCLQLLRLTTFVDVLDARRHMEKEVSKIALKETKPQPPKEKTTREVPNCKREAESQPQRNLDSR